MWSLSSAAHEGFFLFLSQGLEMVIITDVTKISIPTINLTSQDCERFFLAMGKHGDGGVRSEHKQGRTITGPSRRIRHLPGDQVNNKKIMEMDDSISDGNEDWGRRRKREYAIDRASYHMYSISARSGLSCTRGWKLSRLFGRPTSLIWRDCFNCAG